LPFTLVVAGLGKLEKAPLAHPLSFRDLPVFDSGIHPIGA